jgi:hypothetical protein
MTRNFLFYWRSEEIAAAIECGRLNHAASEQFKRLEVGDTIWICGTTDRSRLATVGPLRVDEIVDQREAERRLGHRIWDAEYHVLAHDPAEAREVPLDGVLELLTFNSRTRPRLQPSKANVGQQLQTMRQLTEEATTIIDDLYTLGLTTTSIRDEGRVPAERTGPSFSHLEIFPLIARLILRAPPDADGFVSHGALVSALLEDGEGSAVVERARTASSWGDDRSAASNMVAWFSQQITVGRSPWSDFFDRERRAGSWAYRPKTAVRPPIAPDVDLAAIEGEPRMFFHVRRERDSTLVEAKRSAARGTQGRLICEACGFAADTRYPGFPGEVCEVHHRRPLAEASGSVETRLEDLAVLCANCHRAIHQTRPLMGVEEFRSKFVRAIFTKAG